MTIKQYAVMELAMFEKECETLDMLRSIRADIRSFAGMGLKGGKILSPQDVSGIPIIDNKNIIVPIRSVNQAIELLNTFEN